LVAVLINPKAFEKVIVNEPSDILGTNKHEAPYGFENEGL